MSRFSDHVLIGDLRKPVRGVIPSGVVVSDVVSSSPLTFHTTGRTAIEYCWNSYVTSTTGSMTEAGRLDGTAVSYPNGRYPFNNQGQKWIRHIRPTFGGPQTYGGVCNCATPRRFSAPGVGLSNEIFPHITTLEFLFTGIDFSVTFMNLGGNGSGGDYGGNCDMYIEVDGQLYQASDKPKITNRSDGKYSYRNVVFDRWQTDTKVRLVFGTAGFYGIRTDTRSILRPAANRHTIGFESDSYGESSQALCADNVHQFFTTTIMEYLFRKSQFSWPGFGQGSTGFNSNGAAQVFDDTVGSMTQTLFPVGNVTVTGLSRYFSGPGAGVSSRRGWLTDANTAIQAIGKPAFTNYSGEFLGGPLGLRPLGIVVLGTWNDRSSGLANPVSYSQMYERVGDCWDWVHSIDPFCKVFHVSPEPFNDGLFNTNDGVGQIGPPVRGDVMTRAQAQAAAEREWVEYINIYNPDNPLWTGMGPAALSEGGAYNVPSNSPQAQLVSPVDSIHGKMEMHDLIASKIIDEISDTPVDLGRVNGLR